MPPSPKASFEDSVKVYVKKDPEKSANRCSEKFGYDVAGISGYVDPGISGDTMEPYMEFETYNDYPEAAKNNACKVLRWREEHGDEVKGMTE